MKTNTSKSASLYFILVCFCSCGLFFDIDCINGDKNNYKFYLPFTLYPAQDTFHINDTIWLHANFSDELLDSNSLNYYRVENEPLMCYFYFIRIDTTPTPHYTNQFSIEVDTGNIITSPDPQAALRYIAYEYDKSRYLFCVKFIPHQTGAFVFGFGSEPNQEVDFQKKCPGELMDIYFTTNDGADNNFYLMALSPDSSINAVPQAGFQRDGSYCFRVVE